MGKASLRGVTAIHVLLVLALLEVVINRCAVPMLRPMLVEPPPWHTALDYTGLFIMYFTGVLAVMVIVARCVAAVDAGRGLRDVIASVALGVAALIAAVPLLVTVPPWTSFLLEIVFALAVLAVVVSVFAKDRDLGVQVGLPLVALPLLYHTGMMIAAELVWPEGAFEAPGGPGATAHKVGVVMLQLAALATPYCFAPRPFARAVTRPIPIIVAMAVAAGGAVVARLWYSTLATATHFAIGIQLSVDADRKLALYLLAIATLSWTLSACAFAGSQARRLVGLGIAFLVLAGYDFAWPHHYLLALLGVALIAEAARDVREEEVAAMPFIAEAPPIADSHWSGYVGAVAQGLRRSLTEVHSLTTRAESGIASSVVVGEAAGLPVRTRIERYEGSVVAVDVVIGREIDELRGSTMTVWAMPPRGAAANPPGPPAAPLFKSGDASFDSKFRLRGNAQMFGKLFDDDARGKAIAALDGWLAFWDREGLRYRIYPGRGAPLDHPLPLSDLALGRAPNPERLVAVVELLIQIASRALEPQPRPAEPVELPEP
jgi:hypothetical protein